MRKILLVLIVVLCFSACGKYDNSDKLKGKTFIYWHEEDGELKLTMSYTFNKDGHVIHSSKIGDTSTETIEHLKYSILNDELLTIYKDNHTYWKKEDRNTIYSTGVYRGPSITIYEDEHLNEYILQ